jgi:hypothetical protein
MPQYFFNVYYEHSNIDSIGEELADNQAAWREATSISGELLRDLSRRFQPGQEWRLEVMDASRKPLYVIRLSGEEVK